jgi:hypothetical protein
MRQNALQLPVVWDMPEQVFKHLGLNLLGFGLDALSLYRC